jgi:enediyne biosynthesis protein E4
VRRRRWLWILAIGLVAAGAATWALDQWRLRADWDRARQDLAAGRPDLALPRLARLAKRWPNQGEAQFQLGVCELAVGHVDRAIEAWKQVPPASRFAAQAAMMSARQALARDRLSVAEELLLAALGSRGPHVVEARVSLIQLFKIQGRYDEARRLIREGWQSYPDRVGTLKELARLGTDNPIKIEKLRPILETARRNAPDDDRVWLGWANLAIQTGRLDMAREWLDACLRRRPDDLAVWRVRLDWARAAEDESEVRRALARLPGEIVPPNEVLGLGAWFARRSGDLDRERRFLEDLMALDVKALWAMERLAELLLRAGQPERAEQLRASKGELERVLDWYLVHVYASDRLDHATDLARAAERIGRRFEARCWWELAAARPGQAQVAKAEIERLARAEAAAQPPAWPTPADLLAELASDEVRARSTGATRPGGAAPRFVDDAGTAGLHFTYDNGVSPRRQVPETMGGGVGLLDYDGDGWLDIYVVQGGPFPPRAAERRRSAARGDRLYRNRGDGVFEDVTVRSGVAALRQGYGHGVAVGDVDNDGRPDVFLTRWGSYALYHNRGDGTFEDVTDSWGLAGDRDWPTSAAFADLDGDGDLDLYVCHYIEWDADHPRICYNEDRTARRYCGPPEFKAMPDHLFRNDGGRFVDVTREAGIVDRDGRGLGVVITDLDGDGRDDIYVANDGSAKFCFRNRGGLQFQEVGHVAGVACNAAGACQASMGVACGDFNGDGRPDLAVTNYYNEYTALYLNLGDGVFSDHTAGVGLAVPSRSRLGFGAAFLDFNNDGRLDLATANGHVEDLRPAVPFQMTAQLFAGAIDGAHLVDVTDRAGPAWQVPLLGRGMAAGDLDNDGRVDLVIVPQNQNVAYLHNRTDGGLPLTLLLEGTRSNRDAVGACVTLRSGGRCQVGYRFGGGSYQSAGDPRLHFGLGTADRVDWVDVRWPSGRVDRYTGLQPGRGYRLREGDARAGPLPRYRRALPSSD